MKSIFFSIFTCMIFASSSLFAQTHLEKLKWLEGSWVAKKGTHSIDEHWSLQGQSLMGISRTLDAGKSKSVELLMLEQQGENWVLRLRMFGPAIDKATRGKEEPLFLKMKEVDAKHVLYEGIGKEEGVSLLYELKTSDSLFVKLSKSRDGKLIFSEEFHFEKAPK